MDNYISEFDEAKVSFEQEEENSETVWYDITDIIQNRFEGKISIMEYALSIEMEIYTFYANLDNGEDKMETVRERFEEYVKEDEFNRFLCFDWGDSISVYNDARRIRITFKNGSVLTATNSEWGGIYLQ